VYVSEETAVPVVFIQVNRERIYSFSGILSIPQEEKKEIISV